MGGRWLSMTKGFNPRPYMRGDFVSSRASTMESGFNPRPYMRGDTIIISFIIS